MAEEGSEEEGNSAALQAFLAKLGGMNIEGVLQAGHQAMLRLLVAKVALGDATHQEMAVLRNMLRDNGMVLGKVIDGQAIKPSELPNDHDDLIAELPAPSDVKP